LTARDAPAGATGACCSLRQAANAAAGVAITPSAILTITPSWSWIIGSGYCLQR